MSYIVVSKIRTIHMSIEYASVIKYLIPNVK